MMSLGLLVGNVEKDRCVGSIFGNQFHFLLVYASAMATVAFWWVIPVIAPFAFLFMFMIRMWACAFWLKSDLLIADAISWSILLGRGTISSLLEIRCLSAKLDRAIGAGRGPACAF